MLRKISLEGVGPASRMELEFSTRINLLTGDNGVGKTFWLDVAWWAMTRTWAHLPAMPNRNAKKPTIAYEFSGASKPIRYESQFIHTSQQWEAKPGRPVIPGLVLYAQIDGGFSVWDPARNYWKENSLDGKERPAAYLFRPGDVWDGLPPDSPKKLCNGLISDWERWQLGKDFHFKILTKVLNELSPSAKEPFLPGELTRIAIDDVRNHPTLETPYGEVALAHASAGVRRIVSLAYLLVWTWNEHLRASLLQKTKPAKEIIFLIDEIETHLHPKWQRVILKALLDVVGALAEGIDDKKINVQLVAATHSPLVLASLEPFFDTEKDSIFEFDVVGKTVEVKKFPWEKQGDVNAWLRSSVFDATEPMSKEAAEVQEEARAVFRKRPTQLTPEIKELDQKIRKLLGGYDPFLIRWANFFDDLVEDTQAVPQKQTPPQRKAQTKKRGLP